MSQESITPPNKVQILPSELCDQIAAGEVVERPASAVKELVENSLDAKAKKIFIDLEAGGRGLLRITDNGHGMRREDAALAIKRHATSKISSFEDLSAIRTLGFRGEALPSIASVSKFRLVTKVADELMGTEVKVEGGKFLGVEDIAATDGTMIEVRELFYNTPARLKFLKKEATELRRVQEMVLRLALVWNQVHFRLTHNGKKRLEVPPHKNPRDRIFGLLGKETYGALHPIPNLGDYDGVSVKGFFSEPTHTVRGTSSQYTYVNGRFVNDRTISAAIKMAYREVIPEGRSAVVIIELSVPPEMVDVNVHPAKTEVRFTTGDPIFRTVYRGIREGLGRAPWVKAALGVDISGVERLATPIFIEGGGAPMTPVGGLSMASPAAFGSGGARMSAAGPLAGSTLGGPWSAETEQGAGQRMTAGGPRALEGVEGLRGPHTLLSSAPQAMTAAGPLSFASPNAASTQTPLAFSSTEKNKPKSWAERLLSGASGSSSSSPSAFSPSAFSPSASNPAVPLNPFPTPAQRFQPEERSPLGEVVPPDPNYFSRLRYIGQYARTYLIATDGAGIVMIHQQAAHERISFERLRATWAEQAPETQKLLFPVQLEFDALRAAAMEEHLDFFERVGFEIEPFGHNVFALKRIPAILSGARYVNVIKDALDELSFLGQSKQIEEAIDRVLGRLARHTSVRGGDALNEEEVESLFAQMDKIDFRATCPHGRPTYFKMPQDELEERFQKG